jgi:hypothetical protein
LGIEAGLPAIGAADHGRPGIAIHTVVTCFELCQAEQTILPIANTAHVVLAVVPPG